MSPRGVLKLALCMRQGRAGCRSARLVPTLATSWHLWFLTSTRSLTVTHLQPSLPQTQFQKDIHGGRRIAVARGGRATTRATVAMFLLVGPALAVCRAGQPVDGIVALAVLSVKKSLTFFLNCWAACTLARQSRPAMTRRGAPSRCPNVLPPCFRRGRRRTQPQALVAVRVAITNPTRTV